jgi:hypothetical protein
MSTNSETFQDRMKPYGLLIGISIISGSIIFVSYFIFLSLLMPCYELGCLFPFLIGLGLQWLLVIPATIVAVFIFNRLTRSNSSSGIHIIVLVGIPLIFNILGATSYFVTSYFDRIASEADADKNRLVSKANFLQNFAFTSIKEEKLLYKKYDDGRKYYIYHAILRADNKTGVQIDQMIFSLSGGVQEEYPTYGENSIGIDGYWTWQGNDGIHMPAGSSDVEIDVEIQEYELTCKKFEKNLSLVYTLDDSNTSGHKSIAIGESISTELKQIACGSAP